jgi:hypothetical protein
MTRHATAADFAEHQPGQPYLLTQQQFCQFAGLPDTTGPSFWAAIAAREANRRFNPLAELCQSEFSMIADNGIMRWWYRSTSGTVMEAVEHRTFSTQFAPGYPGVECTDNLPAATFSVIIPVDRDQPGRYHWERLREGASYCD